MSRSDVEVLREMVAEYDEAINSGEIVATERMTDERAALTAAIEVMEGKGLIAAAQAEVEARKAYFAGEDDDVQLCAWAQASAALEAALPTPPQPNEEKGNEM